MRRFPSDVSLSSPEALCPRLGGVLEFSGVFCGRSSLARSATLSARSASTSLVNRLRLRKNEADKRFLIKRIKRLAIHSQLESTRDSAVKFSQPRQLLPNSNFDRNEDVSTCISCTVAIGQMVAPNTVSPALFTIAGDLTRVKIDADVAGSDIGGIRLGDKASFAVEAFPDRSVEAVVSQPPLAPRMMRTIAIYGVVLKVDNPKLLLRPGMIVMARIITAKRTDVLRVPDEALQFSPSGEATPPGLSVRRTELGLGSP